jgi:hypothetical protein
VTLAKKRERRRVKRKAQLASYGDRCWAQREWARKERQWRRERIASA